jgi:hypothetical protein
MNKVQVPALMRVVKYDSSFSIFKEFRTYDITIPSKRKGVSTRIQCDGLAVHKPLTWHTYKDNHDNIIDKGIGYAWRVPIHNGGCMVIVPSVAYNYNNPVHIHRFIKQEMEWHMREGWITVQEEELYNATI